MKRIAVILVDWNGVEVTRECLRSLSYLNKSNLYSVQIILVDNGSAIPIMPILIGEFPGVIYFRSELNLGFAGGNNIGIRYAIDNNYDYSVLLNNDTTVSPEFIEKLFSQMETDSSIGVTQPKIYFQHNKEEIWNAGNRYNSWLGITSTIGYGQKDKAEYNFRKEMRWATGCAMMIRNAIFTSNNLSFLNENYETYYEDVEFSFRVKKAGFRILYVPDSTIYHIAGYSVNSNTTSNEGRTHPFIVYLHSRNRIFLLRQFTQWYKWPTVFIYQSVYFTLLICRFLFLQRPAKLKNVFRAVRDGLSMNYLTL
jgi:GT2 family glycosyltransferase